MSLLLMAVANGFEIFVDGTHWMRPWKLKNTFSPYIPVGSLPSIYDILEGACVCPSTQKVEG